MKIISFAETTSALLAGRKTCTRRQWKPSHAWGFHIGDLVKAYDRSPRVGGKPIAIIQIVQQPEKGTLPRTDWEAEGFAYMEEHGLTLFHGKTPRQVWESWKLLGGVEGLYVVRFKLVEVLPEHRQ